MSLEEQIECPLCMEPLEMDDICFYPCTCGYQICRFCWHRIRTDENGLCPACRKPYQEDPAEFKPLTEEELQRIKKERRQKDLQRKQKAAENRKHLANVRVVQKNLVFVVGLSQRLGDPDALKKHEYFGKFGKIHKVVINQSTSYAGAQGPSASAYVTYNRPEDALRAIQAVNNIFVDGRTIKASLGTTKYCSHFLRGAQCPKPDCMYLHELGEEAASFTKEEMQQGKHQEYEQKLYEMYVTAPPPNQTSSTNTVTTASSTITTTTKEKHSKRKNGSPVMGQQPHPPHQNSKDAWPSLSNNGKAESRTTANGHKAPPPNSKSDTSTQSRTVGNRNRQNSSSQETNSKTTKAPSPSSQSSQPSPPLHTSSNSTEQPSPPIPTQKPPPQATTVPRKVPFTLDSTDSSLSLFSSTGFPTVKNPQPLVQPPPQMPPEDSIPTTEITDSIPVSYATDWQAAFGFGSSTLNTDSHEDDLGFDPWRESSKALTDLIEKEATTNTIDERQRSTIPPPGFTPNHIGAYSNSLRTGIEQQSRMLKLLSLSSVPSKNNPVNTYNDVLSDYALPHRDGLTNNHIQNDMFNMKDWQEGLRALLPNINISFGGNPGQQTPAQQTAFPQPNRTQAPPVGFSHPAFTQSPVPQMPAQPHKPPPPPPQPTGDLSWDPAIVSSGNITEGNPVEEPHWMASLQHLTEIDTPAPSHRFPYMPSYPLRAPNWGTQTQHPPPGFQTPLRNPAPVPETQKLTGGLQ